MPGLNLNYAYGKKAISKPIGSHYQIIAITSFK